MHPRASTPNVIPRCVEERFCGCDVDMAFVLHRTRPGLAEATPGYGNLQACAVSQLTLGKKFMYGSAPRKVPGAAAARLRAPEARPQSPWRMFPAPAWPR